MVWDVCSVAACEVLINGGRMHGSHEMLPIFFVLRLDKRLHASPEGFTSAAVSSPKKYNREEFIPTRFLPFHP